MMGGFFTRERFGRPQFLAGLLLLLFLAECVWLVRRSCGSGPDRSEEFRIREGIEQWSGGRIAGSAHLGTQPPQTGNEDNSSPWYFTADGYDPYHSAVLYLIASAGLVLWPHPLQPDSLPYWGWLARVPFLLFGVLLGASLWYVARRLYGNAGGYIALALYCFSPLMIRSTAVWRTQPEIGAAWGAFGAVFTAIAVAHTLYAPREVVLWNWRRIVLLGLSLALAVGSQFSLVVAVPVALGFMLYLAPERRAAALAIWVTSCALACVLLYAAYFFHPAAFWEGMRHAKFGVSWQPFAMGRAYWYVGTRLMGASPALTVAAPVALITYCAWRRARYFANTAPLLVAVLFLVLAVGTPHYPGFGFVLMAVPFVLLFAAGVCADLAETRQRSLVLACVWGLLAANALWSVVALARVG